MDTTTSNPEQVIKEESCKMSKLVNMLIDDFHAILAVYKPVVEHLTTDEIKYFEKLKRGVLILEEK